MKLDWAHVDEKTTMTRALSLPNKHHSGVETQGHAERTGDQETQGTEKCGQLLLSIHLENMEAAV